jgi:uncharacterized SAM-binding protein YcdF (DUF218 family)
MARWTVLSALKRMLCYDGQTIPLICDPAHMDAGLHAWFAIFLPQPAGLDSTDGVVVLTGGAKTHRPGTRNYREKGKARRMLISGVDLDVKPAELAAEYDRPMRLFNCCIDLGFRAVDTRSNALETARWVARNKVKTLRVVTHDWHMRVPGWNSIRSPCPTMSKFWQRCGPTKPSLLRAVPRI